MVRGVCVSFICPLSLYLLSLLSVLQPLNQVLPIVYEFLFSQFFACFVHFVHIIVSHVDQPMNIQLPLCFEFICVLKCKYSYVCFPILLQVLFPPFFGYSFLATSPGRSYTIMAVLIIFADIVVLYFGTYSVVIVPAGSTLHRGERSCTQHPHPSSRKQAEGAKHQGRRNKAYHWFPLRRWGRALDSFGWWSGTYFWRWRRQLQQVTIWRQKNTGSARLPFFLDKLALLLLVCYKNVCIWPSELNVF